MTASDLPAATARRPWYQSIAGNLLVAFALIAALTVGATLLSLIRFNQIDAVMNRLTGVSLPLVQSSLGVEAKTAELVVLATELSKAENEAQRFQRMENLSDQIGQLWAVLSRLQNIISEEATAARLQQLVAAINTNVGDLDRSTREILLLSDRRSKAIDKAEATNEAGLRLLLQVTDDILSRIGTRITQGVSGQTDAPDLQRDLASLRAAYTARADFNRVTTLLNGIATATTPMPCRDCASNSPSLPTACRKAWRCWHRMQPRAWATFATLPDRWLPSAPPTTDCWRSRPNSCRNGRLSPRSRQLCRRSASICASRFRSSTRAPNARRPAPRRCRRRRSTPAGYGSS